MKNPRSARHAPLALLALGAATLVGCTDAPPAAPPVAEGDFSDSYTAALCGTLFRCCTSAVEVEALTGERYANEAECNATLGPTLRMMFADAAALVAAGVTRYDAAAAGRCIAGVETWACGVGLASGPPTCDSVYVGTVAPGGPCTRDEQCRRVGAVSAYCDAGTCTLDSPRPLDAVCGDTTSWNCASGSVCNGTACVALLPLGSVCGDGSQCATSVCVGGICYPPLALGVACVYDGDCSSSHCDTSHLCAAPLCSGT